MPFLIEEPEAVEQQGRFAIEEPQSSKKAKKLVNRGQFSFAEGDDRQILRSLSRAGETIAGLPGDLNTLGKSVADFLLNKLGLPTPQQEPKVNLPTSSDLTSFMNKATGGYLEPQTEAERFADEVVSDAATLAIPFGGGKIKALQSVATSIGANLAKKGVEKLGGGAKTQEAAKLGGFIAGGLVSTSKGAKAIANTTEGAKIASGLRNLGHNETAIQTAVNATEKEGSLLYNWVKGTTKSKEAAEGAKLGLQNLFDKTLSSSLSGIEDLGAMEARAGALFEAIPNVKITNPKPFIKTADSIVSDLKNTLANTPDEVSIIKMIEDSVVSASENPNSEAFINFYQSLNRAGKWLKPKMRERIFTEMKDSIKQSFADSGKEGQSLVKQFERANQGWVEVNKARETSKILEKAISEEGVDFKKMNNIFNNNKSANILSKNLGKNNVKMLKDISKRGNDVVKLTKRLETPSFADQLSKYGLAGGLVTSIAKMNPSAFLSAIGVTVTKEASQRLAGKMLTDPNFQRLTLKTLKNAGTASARELAKYQQEAIDLVSGYDLD